MKELEVILSLVGVVMAIEIPILLAVIPAVSKLSVAVATQTECIKYLDNRVKKLEGVDE